MADSKTSHEQNQTKPRAYGDLLGASPLPDGMCSMALGLNISRQWHKPRHHPSVRFSGTGTGTGSGGLGELTADHVDVRCQAAVDLCRGQAHLGGLGRAQVKREKSCYRSHMCYGLKVTPSNPYVKY